MRLLAVAAVFAGSLLAQQSNRPGQKQPIKFPETVPSAQPAESVDIPVTKDMLGVLQAMTDKLGYADTSALVTAIVQTPGELAYLASLVGSAPAGGSVGATTVTAKLNAAVATKLEYERLNLHDLTPTLAANGDLIYAVMFATKEDMLRAALKARSGPFWNFCLIAPTPTIAAAVAAGGPTSDPAIAAITAVVQ